MEVYDADYVSLLEALSKMSDCELYKILCVYGDSVYEAGSGDSISWCNFSFGVRHREDVDECDRELMEKHLKERYTPVFQSFHTKITEVYDKVTSACLTNKSTIQHAMELSAALMPILFPSMDKNILAFAVFVLLISKNGLDYFK